MLTVTIQTILSIAPGQFQTRPALDMDTHTTLLKGFLINKNKVGEIWLYCTFLPNISYVEFAQLYELDPIDLADNQIRMYIYSGHWRQR